MQESYYGKQKEGKVGRRDMRRTDRAGGGRKSFAAKDKLTPSHSLTGVLSIKIKDKARHDRMVSLVEMMHDLNKRSQTVRTPDEKVMLERQIGATDREIDQLVYELYGLTEEEIRMVEEAGKGI